MYPVSKKIGVFFILIYLNSDNLYSLYSLTPLLSLFISSLFLHTSLLIPYPSSLTPLPLPPPSLFISPTYLLIPHPLPSLILPSPSPLIPPVYSLIHLH